MRVLSEFGEGRLSHAARVIRATLRSKSLMFAIGFHYETGTEVEVMVRCHERVLAGGSIITKKESDRVIRGLAELLAWTPPLEFGEVDPVSPSNGLIS